VDWRKKMKDSVEFFHETAGLDVLQLSKLIRSHGIHILIDWDGYSHNGIRPTGLFPIQSAPIQVVHQEYIGTMGASFFQYQVSDPVASPPEMHQFHTEKLILMPHTFFVNSFAYQEPHLERPPEIIPSSKQPAVFGCGGPPASFVYCNFNKHLKFDPDTFRAWLKVLKNVDGSVLCLLEFPAESKENIVEFVESFDPDLPSRVRFLPFLANPYDNYRRVVDTCNAVLDTPIYNGHTTSMEALYGGVPVITRRDRSDMSALVGVSALQTLGLTELIADDLTHYQTVAESIGQNSSFFSNVRGRLVASTSCSPKRQINPLWDLRRYVRNLENGFQQIWEKWLSEGKFESVFALDIGGREGVDIVCPSSGQILSSRAFPSRKKKNEKASRRKKASKKRRKRRRRKRRKRRMVKSRAKRRRSEEL
jgi:protein O-GlcNAc transferase